MKLQTKYHGEIEWDQDLKWAFENGIPGFPEEKEFIILPLPENEIFMIMQSLKSPDIAFVLTSPFNFFTDYEFELDIQTIESLEIETEKDVQVMVILTVHDPFSKTTANLQAPIIINLKNNKSKQIILNEKKYRTKHLLLSEKYKKVKE